jgi:hypothetical protein
MKQKIYIVMTVLCLSLTTTSPARAQWTVIDPAHIATSIANASKELVQSSSTASNMLNNFKEVQKVYTQGKEYYDKLKAVNGLIKDALKVRNTILMVGDISDMYVTSFGKMLSDTHFRPEELAAIAKGYTALMQESSDMLMELKDVVNVNGLSMTDAERMNLINGVYERVRRHRDLVAYFTRKNISIAYLRARKAGDSDRVAALYGDAGDKYW